MKKIARRALFLSLSLLLFVASILNCAPYASAASTGYFNTYASLSAIKDRSGCTVMQGMAVGSTWIYTVKIKSDESKAILQKTNRKTGETINLKDTNGSSTYTMLGHANDMAVCTVDGASNLYIATMKKGSLSLVRMKVSGSTATQVGNYTITYNGNEKAITAITIEKTTSTHIYFLFKSGATIFRGTLEKGATSGTIEITKAFKIDTSSVMINGKECDLSSYTNQGMSYRNGCLYLPLWGGGVGKDNQSVVVVYDITDASSTIKSREDLSFRLTSSTYEGLEIESCGICSGDGRLYINANRWSGDNDGVFYFKNFTEG